MNLKHFLISRFNIDFAFYLNAISPNDQIDWMEYRIDLFFKLTYPTLLFQSERNFYWILLLDENSPISILKKIRDLDFERLLFFVFSSNKNLKNDVNLFLSKKVNSNDLVITTALDSDDGFMPNSIQKIQNIALSFTKFPMGINLDNGYIVNVKTGIFYKKSFRSNPFYSLVEKGSILKTCFYKEHMYMSSIFETVELCDEYYWIQNIHGRNILNEIKGTPILTRNKLPFSLIQLYKNPNFYSIINSIIFYLIFKIKNFIIKFKNFINY